MTSPLGFRQAIPIRKPQPRRWRKFPGPQQRQRLKLDQEKEKRRICVQEGVHCLSALIVSRAVEEILRFPSTPYMLRSRSCLIKHIQKTHPRISRPYQMVISDAEPVLGNTDLIHISIRFFPNRGSRSQKSCLEVMGVLSFERILAATFASRRLRQRLIA